jgi:uncharacterized Ntn-hydrolase superfamily protein
MRRRANTFSICAVDPVRGEAGVAVASYCLSVGGLVPYAEPGVGAIATQAMVNPAYGSRGLELLRSGLDAFKTVHALTHDDVMVTANSATARAAYAAEGLTEEGKDFHVLPPHGRILWWTSRMRQVGVVDRNGKAFAFTGARAKAWAGHVVGEGYCCQGNFLAGEAVLRAMAMAFEAARGTAEDLVAPLYLALRAGEAAGGDRRGKLAASLLVTRRQAHWSGSDRYCDVRVDSHPDAVHELGRILAIP